MALKLFNRATLHEWVHSADFEAAEAIPISRIRAISHIANPRALESDIILICYVYEQQLIAYLGLLPDHITEYSGKKTRFAWLSCLWVHPDQRGKRLTQKLLNAAFDCWQGNLMGTEFVPGLEKLYRKSGLFTAFKVYEGLRLYRRFSCSTWLPPKGHFWQRIRTGLSLMDNILNGFLELVATSPKVDYSSYLVQTIPADIEELIKKYNFKNPFQRGKAELEWIIQFPWIHAHPDTDQDRYHFSVYDPTFRQDMLAIRNQQGDLEAFVLLTLRQRVLKTSYVFCLPPAEDILYAAIGAYCQNHKVAVLLSWQLSYLKNSGQTQMVGFYKRTAIRTYMVSDNIAGLLDSQIMDGDGDCAFT